MARRASARPTRKRLLLAATLLATIVVGLALAVVLGPIVQRQRHVRMLRSDDRERRLDGMRYLINHADEPALRDRLAGLLAAPKTEPRTFEAVARAMKAADAWGPSVGPVWLHYLQHRAEVGGANVREAVAIELLRAGLSGAGVMADDLAIGLIEKLVGDEAGAVRRLALRAAATLAPADAAPMIRRAMTDPERAIAYEAHLFAGWNLEIGLSGAGAPGGPPTAEQLKAMPPEAAMAAGWAWVRKLPRSYAGPLKKWVAASMSSPGESDLGLLDAFVPYLLRTPGRVSHSRNRRAAEDISAGGIADELIGMIDGAAHDPDAGKFAVLKRWRAILSLPLGEGEPMADRLRVLAGVYREAADDAVGDLLAAAAASRLAPNLDRPAASATLRPVEWSGRDHRYWRELAVFENAPKGSLAVAIKPEMPAVIRAAAIRAARDPDDWDWLNAFDADEAAVRHMAAFAAVDRLGPEQLDALIEPLLRSSYRNEVLGGAVLAGLSGRRVELVRRQLKRADHWLVALHLKLALYMMGEPVELKPKTLLVRRDFPAHTVFLALMHTGDKGGLDRFFELTATGAHRPWRDELDRRRYWHTLGRYLPDEAPPFWLWADRALQQFQIDALRAWYITRRAEITFDADAKRYNVPPRLSPGERELEALERQAEAWLESQGIESR